MAFLRSIDGIESLLRQSARPLIVVLGPTASGKTDFSIALALAMAEEGRPGEIVNADSRQLYKHMDIGTAKITKGEMQGVPHHLLDVLDPKTETTAAWYKAEATKAIDSILARGRVPLLVGGSMLYLSAVIDGLAFPVASGPDARARLEDEYDRDGGKILYTRLLEIDPDTAQAFDRANKPYVVRAMEIYEAAGEKPSALKRREDVPYDLFILGIGRSREELARRIGERTRKLFERGWADEVRRLLARGYRKRDPGMKSHGYREIIRALKAGQEPDAWLVEAIAAKARQYAKRQMTWWKEDERIRWIDA